MFTMLQLWHVFLTEERQFILFKEIHQQKGKGLLFPFKRILFKVLIPTSYFDCHIAVLTQLGYVTPLQKHLYHHVYACHSNLAN